MKYFLVDAFTDQLFKGNPAAVVVLERWLNDELMQNLAKENNLSETAFVVKEGENYKLRWFTPGGEIDLCGHATLATSFVLANFYDQEKKEFRFETKSGELIVERKDNMFLLNFPSRMPKKVDVTQQMSDAVNGLDVLEAYVSRDLMLVLKSDEDVARCVPNHDVIRKIADVTGVLVTARGTDCDFVSRAFFPKMNVSEDPVCGSAHCNFIPYWSQIIGKKEMQARQLSARGGQIYCKDCGDRVIIGGQAVLYSIGDAKIETD